MNLPINNTGTDITLRHEEKFICSQRELYLLENRIKKLLPTDKNQIGDSYTIRSIYLDTFSNRLLQESLQGLQVRDKYRIRTYDTPGSPLRLEKKISVGALKRKISCLLSQEEVAAVMEGQCLSFTGKAPLDEFVSLQKTEGMRPTVIVEYERAAYVNQTGNIRITFDREISATEDVSNFFSDQRLTHPVLPEGFGILEVKYDSILPGYIAKALALSSLQRVSFSKYALCRNIINNNGRIEEYYEF